MNPFIIKEPTCISFSGGRTSAYMLWRVLQAHDMSLPNDVKVIFCNTGKEHEATLDFVRDIEKQFNICKEHCSKLITKAKKGELSWYS